MGTTQHQPAVGGATAHPLDDACVDGLEALSEAVLAMSGHLEVREVLRRITASARSLLGAEYAALGVPDDHGASRSSWWTG